jgi:DNA-directed RNA polymerase specialized sigma24 family protein
MKDLSSEDKQILELIGDELSYKEIADLLHISTKKIDNRLRILRKRMGQYLKDEK